MLLHLLLSAVQLRVLFWKVLLPVPEMSLQLFLVIESVLADLENSLPYFLFFLFGNLSLIDFSVHIQLFEGFFKLLFLCYFLLFLFFLFFLILLFTIFLSGFQVLYLILNLLMLLFFGLGIITESIEREGIFLLYDFLLLLLLLRLLEHFLFLLQVFLLLQQQLCLSQTHSYLMFNYYN
jgi:hypothetical protein